MIIYLAGLRQIPAELYEAATVDGAGPARRFAHITLPMLSPVIFFNVLMNVVGAFQAFNTAYIVSNGTGGPADATLFYTLYLYQRGFVDFDMGYASALGWVLLLIVAAAVALLFAISRRLVFYGDNNEHRHPHQFYRHLLLISMGVVMFYPLAWMLGASFRDDSAIGDPGVWPGAQFTVSGYAEGWRGVSGVGFWRFLLNSFVVAAFCVARTSSPAHSRRMPSPGSGSGSAGCSSR